MKISWLVVFFFVTAVVSTAFSDETEATLEVDGDMVIACGVPEFSRVVFFHVSWVEHPWTAGFRSEALQWFDKGKGCAAVQPDPGIEPNSTWVAVLEDGRVIFAAGPGGTLRTVALSSEEAVVWKRGRGMGVIIPGSFVEVLIVRPTGETWRATVGDGGQSDSDSTSNREIVALPSSMSPALDTIGSPEFLSTGDVVIAIDVNPPVVYYMTVGG